MRSWLPVATPAGIRMVMWESSLTRPSPRQTGHGSEMISPVPWQVGQLDCWTKKAALLGNDAAPLAGRTGLERFLSIPGPGTVAGLASHQTLNLKLLGASLRSLFQRDVQIIAQIGTGSLGGPFLAAAAGASEHIRKTAHSGKHLGENIHRILEPSPA